MLVRACSTRQVCSKERPARAALGYSPRPDVPILLLLAMLSTMWHQMAYSVRLTLTKITYNLT